MFTEAALKDLSEIAAARRAAGKPQTPRGSDSSLAGKAIDAAVALIQRNGGNPAAAEEMLAVMLSEYVRITSAGDGAERQDMDPLFSREECVFPAKQRG